MANLCMYTLINRATANKQLHLCTYFSTYTHLLYVYSMPYRDWSLQTLQAALVIKIVRYNNSAHKPMQVSFRVNFTCQWWRACRWRESSERRMSRYKRQDGVEGYIITSTILSQLLSSHFFLFSYCFGTNRFIHHIGRSTQSTGWLLKVVYWGWPCLSFYTIDYSAIHQRRSKPLRGPARHKPSLRRKLEGRKWGGLVMINGWKRWN